MLKDFQAEIKIFLIVALVAIIIAVGAMLFLREMISVPSEPAPASTIDETTNWKTYTNKKYGYSIKYPIDKFENCNDQGDAYIGVGLVERGEPCSVFDSLPPYVFTITPSLSYKSTTSENENCYEIKEENLVISGIAAKKYSYIFKSKEGECRYPVTVEERNYVDIIINDNFPKGYISNIFFYENPDKETKYKILSTFKLIDREEIIDTTNWKTYENKSFGFEVKYPRNYFVDVYDFKGKKIPKFVVNSYVNNRSFVSSAPGLTLNFDPLDEFDPRGGNDIKKFTNNSKIFGIQNLEKDGDIHIYFVNSQNKKIYATCTLSRSSDKDTFDICNRILSTFRFVP